MGAHYPMVTKLLFSLAGSVGTVVLASCAAPPSPEVRKVEVPAALSSKPAASGVTSNQIFGKVNQYRSSRGKSALQRHSGLDRIAQDHCEFLRKNRGSFKLNGRNVSHIGFDGRAAAARHLYQMYSVSENIAFSSGPGSSASQRMLDLWVSSPGHHKNLLDDWMYSGVGVVTDVDGAVISAQLFGNAGMSHLSTRERFNRH